MRREGKKKKCLGLGGDCIPKITADWWKDHADQSIQLLSSLPSSQKRRLNIDSSILSTLQWIPLLFSTETYTEFSILDTFTLALYVSLLPLLYFPLFLDNYYSAHSDFQFIYDNNHNNFYQILALWFFYCFLLSWSIKCCFCFA